MLVGEVKLEALRLMFINMEKSLEVEDLINLYDDKNYAIYLQNMTGAINRAIDRINACKVLPTKSVSIGATKDGELNCIDLSNISDLYEVIALYSGEDKQPKLCEFTYLDSHTIVTTEECKNFKLSYYKKCAHISSGINDNAVIDLPDEVASIVPYYIKSDLYQDDNAVLANDARNKFEQALEELKGESFLKRTITRKYKL